MAADFMVTHVPMDSVRYATKNIYRDRTAAVAGAVHQVEPCNCALLSMGSGVEVPSSQQTVTPPVSEPEESVLPQASSLPLPESVSSSPAETTEDRTSETKDPPASPSDSAQNSSEEQASSPVKAKLKKNRCNMCRKKVGLTGFECRCGNVFCGTHRYSDVHSCSFDYKAEAAAKIRKENPVVVGEKIQKI